MAKRYRPVDRDQEFLLPPNMTEWLPEGHLVWFVIDTVAELDTAAFHARAARCRDGQARRNAAGRAAYDPVMLLILLMYAYVCGERSSRAIERLCATDVAFRLICAQDAPDHTVISRFRKTHLEAFLDVFAQVLRLCREAGLARLGTVAIDGSKIAANASMQANRGEQWLRDQTATTDAEDTTAADRDAADRDAADRDAADRDAADREMVEQILAEAERVDEAEDAAYGPGVRGDELPPSWHGRAGRQERIRAALAKIEAAKAARRAEQAQQAAERAQKDAAALAEAEQALAAEMATREAARDAWEAQWEHAATHPGTPLPRGRAPVPAEQSVQVRRARARVEKARHRVEHPDTAPRPGGHRRRGGAGQTNEQIQGGTESEQAESAQRTRRGRRGRRDPEQPPAANLTDPDSAIMPVKNGGWGQCYNGQLSVSQDHFILVVHISTNPADITSYQVMVDKTEQTAADFDAVDELGTLLLDTGYCSDDTLAAPGPDRLIATGTTRSVGQAARDNPTTGPPPEGASPREAMDHRLRTPDGAKLYTRRGATVEPTIGNLKKIIDRFSLRGLAAVTAEAHLAAAAFNLAKLHRATTAATA